ncbi:MAG: coiled-coil domain-containing protein, partial [Actinomycetota bacterium]
MQKELNSVANEYTRTQSRLDRTNTQQRRLEEESRKNEQTIARRSEALQKRAGSIYRRGAGGIWTDLLTSPDLGVFVRRLYFLERLGDQDTRLVEQLRIAQGRGEELRSDLASARSREAALARQLKARQARLEGRLREAMKAEESRKRAAAAKLKASRTVSESQRRSLEAA